NSSLVGVQKRKSTGQGFVRQDSSLNKHERVFMRALELHLNNLLRQRGGVSAALPQSSSSDYRLQRKGATVRRGVRSWPGRRPVLEEGRNCWRIENAARVGFLIDGDTYFRAFRAVAAAATQSIVIIGWDFDSRIRMLIDRESDGLPDRIG